MGRKAIGSLLLLVLFSLLLAGCLGGGEQTGSLKIKIVDESGQSYTGQAAITLGSSDHPVEGEVEYLFSKLNAGALELKVEVPGYKPHLSTVNIAAGQTATHVANLEKEEPPPAETGGLEGDIYEKEIGDEIVPSATLPDKILIAVTVTLEQAGQTIREITATNGEYAFAEVVVGDYTLKATAEGYEPYSAMVEIEADEVTIHDVMMEMLPKPKGALSGAIRDAVSGELITGAVTVTLDGIAGTVIEGEYLFADLSEGTKVLRVQASGYKTYSQEVEIEEGENKRHDVELVLQPAPSEAPYIFEVPVPGGTGFPLDVDDSEICTENISSFYMSQFEVTYRLWRQVYDWATGDDLAGDRYYFQNPGKMGFKTVTSAPTHDLHPVMNVSWRDAVVWCNALTEYTNAFFGSTLECVYTYEGQILRDSRDSNAEACDNVACEDADGYRLPTKLEWELAARYQNGSDWTPGDHVSGDVAGPCFPSTHPNLSPVFGDYTYYSGNSGTSRQVGGKLCNQLEIYDLSGNAWEWCFDLEESWIRRVVRGGGCTNSIDAHRLGWSIHSLPSALDPTFGFRPVRAM